MDRAYTVKEIDALRLACKDRWVFGTTSIGHGMISRSFKREDMDRGVEELMRTYMLAGITAEQIYAEDLRNDSTVPVFSPSYVGE